MHCSRPVLASCFLLILAAIALGCGNRGQLQSIALNPTTADAKNFPSGQVQFTATGTFSGSTSMKLGSPQILWCVGSRISAANPTAGVCSGNIAQLASIDQNGLAQCLPPQQGTTYILAGTYTPQAVPDQGEQLKIFGSAQLTCP